MATTTRSFRLINVLFPFHRRSHNALVYTLLGGATIYTSTIGLTTNQGRMLPLHDNPSTSSSSKQSSTPLSTSPADLPPPLRPLAHFLSALKPQSHPLQSDMQTIRLRIPASAASDPAALLTALTQNLFHGWAFATQRAILTHLQAKGGLPPKPEVPAALLSAPAPAPPVPATVPHDPAAEAADHWDLRGVRDVTRLAPGTNLLSHFAVLQADERGVVLLFGDPRAESDTAGVLQIRVDDVADAVGAAEGLVGGLNGEGRDGEGEQGRGKVVIVSMSTGVWCPKERRHAFGDGVWRLHMLYSRLLLQNAVLKLKFQRARQWFKSSPGREVGETTDGTREASQVDGSQGPNERARI